MPEPIADKRQLVEFFASSARPKDDACIVSLHERFAYKPSTLQPVAYDEPGGLRDWLEGMKGFGWNSLSGEKAGTLTHLIRGRSMIALGANGKVIFTGSPLRTLHEIAAEIDQHFTESCEIGDALGIGFLGMGYHPMAQGQNVDLCCGMRVGLNYADEADMVRKFRIALALQPVATALFASSPFDEGKPNGWRSNRARVLNEARLIPPDFAFEDGFGFERYADYILANEKADPDLCLTGLIEVGGADTGSPEMLLALAGFWTGILYDPVACDGAWQLVKTWNAEERSILRMDAARLGFRAEVAGRRLADIAQDAVKLARDGLRRRANRLYEGADETRSLALLDECVVSEQSRADQLLMQAEHFKDFTLASVFETCRMLPPPDLRDEEDL